LVVDAKKRQSRVEEREAIEHESVEELAQWLWKRAVPLLSWSPAPRLTQVTSGCTGFARALDAARRDLVEGRARTAIVAGVDSLLDLDTLLWLHDCRRLKYDDMPVGIEPGEAAACVLLETEPAPSRPLRIALTAVCYESTRAEPSDVLRRAIQGAMSEARAAEPPPTVMLDHDGTEARGVEWGRVWLHLNAIAKGYQPMLVYPAVSMGTVGSAFGAVASCMAVVGLSRGYAKGSSVLVVSGDRPSARTAHILSRA
jgi:3-oxoacyl-(acyl-carrier-protein) synthase